MLGRIPGGGSAVPTTSRLASRSRGLTAVGLAAVRFAATDLAAVDSPLG